MEALDPTLGYSLWRNMAARTIELLTPMPDENPGELGPRSGLAIDRYMKGEVIKPDLDNMNMMNGG